MIRKDSAPEFDPRHRILGAIVVIGLAVVVIPMVLSEAPPTAGPAAVRAAIEAPAERPNRVVITPVAPPEASAAAPAPAGEPAQEAEAAQGAEPAQEAEPAPVATAPAAPESGWVVQVGTFANAANARRLEQQLKAGGESTLTERVRLDSGEAVRLRVGPFADREAAQQALARIRKEVGLKGVVLAYP